MQWPLVESPDGMKIGVDDAAHHDRLVVRSPITKCRPLEILEHFGDTVAWIEVRFDRAGCTSLDYLQLVDQVMLMRVPYC